MTIFDWLLRGAAFIIGLVLIVKQVGELKGANGLWHIKMAMLILTMVNISALTLAIFVRYGVMPLEVGISINSVLMFCTFLQMFIMYFKRKA